MRLRSETRPGWTCFEFSGTESSPDHFVYALVDAGGSIFYVGVSMNPMMRHRQHNISGRVTMLILAVDRRVAAYAEESRWIARLSSSGSLRNTNKVPALAPLFDVVPA